VLTEKEITTTGYGGASIDTSNTYNSDGLVGSTRRGMATEAG
jgi:hypothetical protein